MGSSSIIVLYQKWLQRSHIMKVVDKTEDDIYKVIFTA